MSDELTKEEVEAMAALMACLWSRLKNKDPVLDASEAIAEMKDAQFDCGGGRTIAFDTPEVRTALSGMLCKLAEDTYSLAQYMYEHPGKHSALQLARATGSQPLFVEVTLYKLIEAGIVRKAAAGYSTEVDPHGKPVDKPRPVYMYQIVAAVWLKEVERRQQADARDATNADR